MNLYDTIKRYFRKYLTITIVTSSFVLVSFYIFVEIIIYKANSEIVQSTKISYKIQQLKDIHTFCILDYRYNSTNEDILKDCKKVENKIVLNMNRYNENTPYLNFYSKYIQ